MSCFGFIMLQARNHHLKKLILEKPLLAFSESTIGFPNIFTVFKIGTYNWHIFAIQNSLTMPFTLVQSNQRHYQIGSPRPFDTTHRHINNTTLRQHLI